MSKHENRAAKASKAETASESCNSSNLDVPLDVLGVISQFLAGDHAFGTLANLHLASHAVRDETLPVLYETVLFDNVKNLPYYGGGGKIRKPKGFRYTKFYLCTQSNGLVLFNLTSLFPNLLMTIMASTKFKGNVSTSYNEFTLCIHKPVSTGTVFGKIFRTPMHHSPFPHEWCRQSGLGVIGSLRIGACDKDAARPLVRAPETVRYFYLADGAYLVNTDTRTSRPEWTTNVQLEDACFVYPPFMQEAKEAHADTVVELLKLADRQQDSRYLRQLDNRLALAQTVPSMAPTCQNARLYNQYHLSLNITPIECAKLAKKFIQSLVASPDRPRYRLKVLLCGVLEKESFDGIFDTFSSLYFSGNLPTRLLPGVGPRHTVLAMASAFGQPKGHDLDFAIRYVAYFQFTRRKGSSELVFRKQVHVEKEEEGTTAVDTDFGVLHL